MGFWEIFWAISILFALVSFSILSIKVLFNGFRELKEMLTALDVDHKNSD